MPADHCAKEQQDKDPPDELKGEHWLPLRDQPFLLGLRG